MDVAEFARVLDAGLGRPTLYLRDHDDAPYRDVILDACLYGSGYDRQLEDKRGEYFSTIIQRTRDPHRYRRQIIAALLNAHDDDEYDVKQLFQLARLFAAGGDSEARQAMYAVFARQAVDAEDNTFDRDGAADIIQLDGADGFRFVLGQFDWQQLPEDDAWIADYLLRTLEERIGKDEAADALAELAREDRSVAAFGEHALKRCAERAEESARHIEERLTYEQVRQVIADPKDRRKLVPLQRWGRDAFDEDIARAARELLDEDDPVRLYGYVLIFGKRSFPLAPDKLIALAESLPDREYDPETASIREKTALRSWNALELVHHPSVRALALRSLRSNHWAGRAVGLLTSNYQEGDHLLMEACFARQQSDRDVHDVGLNALQVFEANPVPERENMLKMIYERGPCSLCRGRCVEQLIALKRLPRWMAEECQFDADESTRKRAAEYLASPDSTASVN